MYVDETGLNDNEIPSMAWAHSGVRVSGPRPGRRRHRVSVAASLKAGKLTSALVLDSPFNGSSFEEFVSKVLLKNCCPGDTIIMDNATIHRSQRIRQLVEAEKCHLMGQAEDGDGHWRGHL